MKRTALKAPTVDQVRAWQQRPRNPIRKVGRKGRRERASIAFFNAKVAARASDICQASGLGICNHVPHYGSTAHHIWPEDRDAGRHDPERGAWLCFAAHRWVHTHPLRAGQLGLLRPDRSST